MSSVSWIKWFCGKEENKFFCEVNEDYIRDSFNLTGLEKQVPNLGKAVSIILGNKRVNLFAKADERLYGLIHARYILTVEGIGKMLDKSNNGDFGYCLRHYCEEQLLLPIGLSDKLEKEKVKVYCAKCLGVFNPSNSIHGRVDGAYFGTSFPHMVFMTYPDYRPKSPSIQSTSVTIFQNRKAVSNGNERIFGFRIHPSAYEIQQEARRKAEDRLTDEQQ